MSPIVPGGVQCKVLVGQGRDETADMKARADMEKADRIDDQKQR